MVRNFWATVFWTVKPKLQFALGAKFTPGDRRLNGTDIDDTTLIPFSGVGRPSVPQKPKGG